MIKSEVRQGKVSGLVVTEVDVFPTTTEDLDGCVPARLPE